MIDGIKWKLLHYWCDKITVQINWYVVDKVIDIYVGKVIDIYGLATRQGGLTSSRGLTSSLLFYIFYNDIIDELSIDGR